jgi:hypothetical protein
MATFLYSISVIDFRIIRSVTMKSCSSQGIRHLRTKITSRNFRS